MTVWSVGVWCEVAAAVLAVVGSEFMSV
ncbi:hypothetical protein E3A20_22660, partial [Planctomyces bekefii]